jgi:hypothetical protein
MTELEREIAGGAVRALLEQERAGGEWIAVLDGKEHWIVVLDPDGGTVQVTDESSEDGLTVEYAIKVTVELTETYR